MPRPRRVSPGGICYHAIQRSNDGSTVFHGDGEYRAFLAALGDADDRVAMPLLAYCLMPNHVHLVVRPEADGDLSRWMGMLFTTFARRYHRVHGTRGHLWQGRFKAFPIEADDHLLTVLRYVERNPLRAGLVDRAADWTHSSLRGRGGGPAPVPLAPSPVPLPADWADFVDRPLTSREREDADLVRLRRCVNRGAPFGGAGWTASTADRLNLRSAMRPRGRPAGHGGHGGEHPPRGGP
ncbi:MAG: transposase [Hyphomicrobiales bacterium]|nr:transposase [Hyphomicrobiales bacterium]MCP5373438.1 transposase [Hyphomicrobiales bacterium]